MGFTDTSKTSANLGAKYGAIGDGDVTPYLSFVRMIAGNIYMKLPLHVRIDDLNSAGLEGLMNALVDHKPETGMNFQTYARIRIRGAILDYLREKDYMPRRLRIARTKINRESDDISTKLEREPTQQEIAEQLGWSLDKLSKIQDYSAVRIFSLDTDANVLSTMGYEILEEGLQVPDETESRLDTLIRWESVTKVRALLGGLSEKEQKVIELYYEEGLTMKEAGEVIGVTESRFSQIHSEAIRKLRQFNTRRPIFHYLNFTPYKACLANRSL